MTSLSGHHAGEHTIIYLKSGDEIRAEWWHTWYMQRGIWWNNERGAIERKDIMAVSRGIGKK